MGGVIGSLFLGNEQIDLIEAQPISDQELLQAVQAARPHIVILFCAIVAQAMRFMFSSSVLRCRCW